MPGSEPVLDLLGTGPGRAAGFIERHGLWDDARYAAAAQAQRVIDERGIELVRLSFPDQHGLLRGKTLTREAFFSALRGGTTAPSTLVVKDTACKTIYSVFEAGGSIGIEQMEGAGDLLLIPDPTTFRVLPWAPRTAWALCDIHFPDGRPVPFSTRHLLADQVAGLAARGYELIVGLEVEFHVFKARRRRARRTPTSASRARRRRCRRSAAATSCCWRTRSTRSTRSCRRCATGSSGSACRCCRSSTSSARPSWS